jgi:phenylacetate-coenzyme A ligase PaaK-like adenylate-forming protein
MNLYDIDPARQREITERRLLRYLRDYVAPYHPYLRKTWREHGIDPRNIRTMEDFRKLPILEKEPLQSHPLLFILRAKVRGAPPLPDGYDCEPLGRGKLVQYALKAALGSRRDLSALVRHDSFRERMRREGMLEWLPIHTHFSTGSSGTPTPVTFTHYDIRKNVHEMASLAIQAKHPPPGYQPFAWDERKMSLFPGAPHVAFYAPLMAKMLVGTPSFETFGGHVIPTEKQIALFVSGGFETLFAIPSYLVYWLRKAAAMQAEGHVGPLRRLRRVILGAEPVSEPLRDHLRQLATAAGADPGLKIIQTAGMTEMKWTFIECMERSGLHMNPKYYYWELLHPETRQPVGPREPGVLVFTHIGWRGTVLVRYWTGDLIKGGMVWDRCEACGWTFPRIFPPMCRAEQDFTKIKGARVDLSLLIETIRDTPGVRTFQASIESEGGVEFAPDQLIVHVIPEAGCSEDDVRAALSGRVKEKTEVSPDRIVFEYDEAAFEKRLFAKKVLKAEFVVERRVGRR